MENCGTFSQCVTARDALERMKFFSSPPRRAPIRSTRAVEFHVYSFYMRHSASVSAVRDRTGHLGN